MNRINLDIHRFVIVASMALVVSCGGGGGGEDDRFPTPTLPADAMKFDATNANDAAQTIVGFSSTFSDLPVLKTETEPSLSQIVDSALDKIISWNRNVSGTAARTEDISAGLCDSGSAIAQSSESGSSSSGDINFTNCDIGGVMQLNGNFAFDASWNDTTLDYNFHTGGTLSITFGTDTVTVMMNLRESGNESTGDFSTDISFSMSGVPGAGFLVETDQRVTGNDFTMTLTAGRLIAYGAGNTRLRITVTGPNQASVDLDDGSGIFVPQSPIVF